MNSHGDYKAFVSSTYDDLQDHWSHVIRELRKAGFFVDPMAPRPVCLRVTRAGGPCYFPVPTTRTRLPPVSTRSPGILEAPVPGLTTDRTETTLAFGTPGAVRRSLTTRVMPGFRTFVEQRRIVMTPSGNRLCESPDPHRC